MYFDTFYKMQQYAEFYPEKIKDMTPGEWDNVLSSRGWKDNDRNTEGCLGSGDVYEALKK